MIVPGNTEIRLPQPRHAIGFFILLVMSIVVLGLFIELILIGAGIGRGISNVSPKILTAFEVVFQALVTVGLIWLFLRLGRFSARATLSRQPCLPSVYLWTLISAISLGVVVEQLVTYLLQAAPGLLSEAILDMARQAVFDNDVGIYVLYALAVSLGPGLTEELAFRGFILRGLRTRLGPVGAVLLTALLFAVLHIDPLWILSVFPFGVFAGYLVVRTGSIYPAIAAHAFNNLWSTVEGSLLQAYNPQAELKDLIIHWNYPPIIIGAAVLLLAIGLYALHRGTQSPPAITRSTMVN